MATTLLRTALHTLRRSGLLRDSAGRSDGELMESFIGHRDQTAFQALMERHGPIVLGVCRRVLRNEADTEDAFQATFLVFVRKAASIRPRGMVGNWLYGVAHSTALKARAMRTKRAAKEREAAARRQPDSADTWHELEGRLDQELKVLPDKYRAAIVLCDLEGKSSGEAVAHQLGHSAGNHGHETGAGTGATGPAAGTSGSDAVDWNTGDRPVPECGVGNCACDTGGYYGSSRSLVRVGRGGGRCGLGQRGDLDESRDERRLAC